MNNDDTWPLNREKRASLRAAAVLIKYRRDSTWTLQCWWSGITDGRTHELVTSLSPWLRSAACVNGCNSVNSSVSWDHSLGEKHRLGAWLRTRLLSLGSVNETTAFTWRYVEFHLVQLSDGIETLLPNTDSNCSLKLQLVCKVLHSFEHLDNAGDTALDSFMPSLIANCSVWLKHCNRVFFPLLSTVS